MKIKTVLTSLWLWTINDSILLGQLEGIKRNKNKITFRVVFYSLFYILTLCSCLIHYCKIAIKINMQIYCNWFTIIYRSLVPLLNFILLIYGGNKNVLLSWITHTLKIKIQMKYWIVKNQYKTESQNLPVNFF